MNIASYTIVAFALFTPVMASADAPSISIRHSSTKIRQGDCETYFRIHSYEEFKNIVITASVLNQSGKLIASGDIKVNKIGGGAEWEGKQDAEVRFNENFADESSQYCTEEGATVQITSATGILNGKKSIC
jgi:hypothetical protein